MIRFVNKTEVSPTRCFIRRFDFFFCNTSYIYLPRTQTETVILSRFGTKMTISCIMNRPESLVINYNEQRLLWHCENDPELVVISEGSWIKFRSWKDYEKMFKRAEQEMDRARRRFDPIIIAELKKYYYEHREGINGKKES